MLLITVTSWTGKPKPIDGVVSKGAAAIILAAAARIKCSSGATCITNASNSATSQPAGFQIDCSLLMEPKCFRTKAALKA